MVVTTYPVATEIPRGNACPRWHNTCKHPGPLCNCPGVHPVSNLPREFRAFTLLEILLTVVILATVAGLVLIKLDGVSATAQDRLSRSDLVHLRAALLRFHDDTGWLPRQGPFALSADGGEVAEPAEGADWFRCPANLVQLLEEPRDAAGDPVFPWNPDSRRGWRGPYLQREAFRQVDLSSGLGEDSSGSLSGGDLVPRVICVLDAHLRPCPASGLFRAYTAGGEALAEAGRPVFLFASDDTAWLQSCGIDGELSVAEGADDPVLELTP